MRLDFFVKPKSQASTMILPIYAKYPVRDLLCDLNDICLTRKVAICVIRKMMPALPLASARLSF